MKIKQGIPSSIQHIGQVESLLWYHHRAEARSGSLWLFESRKKTRGVFSFDTTYLLLRLSENAPAMSVTYTLEPQEGANMHVLEMTMRAQRIRTAADLLPDERGAFKKFVGETRDLVVEVTQSPNELQDWSFISLEPAPKKKATAVVAQGSTRTVAINRIRRIKRT